MQQKKQDAYQAFLMQPVSAGHSFPAFSALNRLMKCGLLLFAADLHRPYTELMNTLQKIRGHLSTINAHKALVTKLCFRCTLYKQGLLHDLSKYSPCELKTGYRYYQGYRSPIEAQKEKEGYSMSWLHHKGRNPHHWEYWLDGSAEGIAPVAMPFNYVAEMFCDRVAASMIYQKEKYTDSSAYDYYMNYRDRMMIHPESDRQIVYLLTYLKEHGLDAAIDRIKELLREYRSTGKVTLEENRL